MKTIKQISVFLENKKGRLTQVTEILKSSGVDITAFSVADSSEFGILRMIVSDAQKAQAELKNAGLSVMITEVVAVRISQEMGSLHTILEMLTGAGVQIEYLYAFAFQTGATAVIRSAEIAKTVEVLEKFNQILLEEKDIKN